MEINSVARTNELKENAILKKCQMIKTHKTEAIPPNRKYSVFEKINEICSPVFGRIYHIDLLYVTTYLFRICKINDLLTRNDKRSKFSLFAHLEQHKKQILSKLNDPEIQERLLDSILKERCICRGQKPCPGTTLSEIIKIKRENENRMKEKAEKAERERENREKLKEQKMKKIENNEKDADIKETEKKEED